MKPLLLNLNGFLVVEVLVGAFYKEKAQVGTFSGHCETSRASRDLKTFPLLLGHHESAELSTNNKLLPLPAAASRCVMDGTSNIYLSTSTLKTLCNKTEMEVK